MNKQQTDYAFDRINNIKSKKIAAFEATLIKAPPHLTDTQKYAEIKSGKAKLKPFEDLGRYPHLFDAYEFSDHKKREDLAKVNKPKREAYEQKINAAAQKLKDDIVFLSGVDVQKSIDEFEKAKF
jgi:hypothetical protein